MVTSNLEEINQARNLGMREIPAPILVPVPFVFHLTSVTYAYIQPGGGIKIHVAGAEVLLESNDEVWKKIEGFIGG